MSSPDARAVGQSIEAICREAGADLRQRFAGPRSIEKKGAIDLVTDADKAAEAIILARLRESFPEAAILAEESGQLVGTGSQTLRFIVDPLDGTTNYAHGIPHFATTVAAADATGLLAGVVYDPLRDELYLAVRGAGATCNGAKLRVSAAQTLGDATLATGFPYDLPSRVEEILGYFSDIIPKARAVRRFGSAALDLAWVAQGRYDGYWEKGLKPWDMAAGVLLVAEAGGVVTSYRGGPVNLEAGECVAATPRVHSELVALTAQRAG